MDEERNEMKQLAKVSILVVAYLSYCYFISCKIPEGKFRFLSLLPIFYLFTTLPLLFSYLFPIATSTLFLTSLGNFKLLLFAFGQGPLSIQPPNHNITLFQFICLATFPIKMKHKEENPSSQTVLNGHWQTKLLIFSILVGLQDFGRENLHPKLIMAVYCCPIYLLIDILFGICNTMVHSISNMELETPSNEPYLSTSLQDFWGKRWNLAVTNLLRQTIFKPVKYYMGSLLAVLVTFLVSGLSHELFFYRISTVSPSWEVTSFFVLHGLCLVMELEMKRFLGGRLRLHPAVAGPLTVGFVVATATWLFFPPLLESGADEKVAEECKMFFIFVKNSLKLN